MKNLWAPWRMKYILERKTKGCFLCDMFKQKKDRRNLILKRGTYCAIVMNRYPYTPGHLMVTPYRHIDSLALMTPEEQSEMMALTDLAVQVLKKQIKPHGFNLGINLGEMAGAGLKDHIHMHIVPRWSGDINFMPVLGDVKVIPQALHETRSKLEKGFKKRT